jgi:hypothetical protein
MQRFHRKRKTTKCDRFVLFALDLEMPGQLNLGLAAVAFISPQNHPILVRAFSGSPDDLLKHHYLAHISLDVIDERGKQPPRPSSYEINPP